MKKSNIDNLVVENVKNVLSLRILSIVSELDLHFNNKDYVDDEIKQFREKLTSSFFNIKKVLALPFEERVIYLDEIKNILENIEKKTLSIFATMYFSDLLNSFLIEQDRLDLAKLETYDYKLALDGINKLLNEEAKNNTIVQNGSVLLALTHFNMPRENFKDYLTKSLNLIFVNNSEANICAKLNLLKFKFAPFKFVKENEETKVLFDILNSNFKQMSKDEILKNLDILENISDTYVNKIGDFYAIYSSFLDILTIYTFAIDIEYITDDDFVLKDIFYYCYEMIENKDFSNFENIEEKVNEKIDILMDTIFKNDKIIENNLSKLPKEKYTEAIKIYIALENYSKIDLETNSISKSDCKNTNVASYEFVKTKVNEFLQFVDDLNINNSFAKFIKQNFLPNIPCPLSVEALKIYFKNNLSSLPNNLGVLASYKIITFANPNLLEEISNHEHIHHNHDDCCDCY